MTMTMTMMKLVRTVSFTLVSILVEGSASAALFVSALAPGGLDYGIGDVVTIDVTISTTGPEALALGLRAADYDPVFLTNATVVEAPDSIFNFSPTVPFGGLPNSACLCEQTPLAGVRPGWSLNLFQGVVVSPAAGVGPETFRIQFETTGFGSTAVNIGVFAAYSDTYLAASGADASVTNAWVEINVLPEPGTAILVGFGLMGLASSRRRR